MEQRQSDDPNEIRTPQPASPDTGNQPADSQPANAKPATDQRETPQRPTQREGNQRNQHQRDNRQQNNRPGGQRDDNQKNNRQDRDAGTPNREQRDAGTSDRAPREAGTTDRPQQERAPRDVSPTDRPQQERAPRDANAPERASQERGQRDGTTPDRAQQERGQRQDRDRTPRDTNAPERGTQERGQQERGQRDANRQERQPRDGSQNQRSDSRPTDRDRSTGNRERSASEPRNAGNRDRQPSDNGDFIDDDADSQDRSLRETGTDIRDERLVIGISLGDYNGIGPEVILKALQYNRLQKICTPVIYGSMRVLNRYRNLLNLKDWNLNGAPTIGQISHKMTNVITCWPDQNQDIQPGQVTADAGQAALACLQRAVDDLKEGKLDALVTAPINKYNIQSDEFKFPGHTEYLAQEFGVDDNLMFLVSERLRVGVVTGHVPLGRVRQNVTKERISQKLSLMMASLRQDFGIEKPKIAVLGLNPHAGEEGLLGNEEQDIIKPVIAEWRNKGQMVFGPYPADGFFGTRGYLKFDAVLAMYHDQGLIPFKAIAFEDGVNFTAGMPAVRTSPDHGTAYDIAGKNLADETSMLQAIYTAIDVARQRKEFADLEENSLSNQSVEK